MSDSLLQNLTAATTLSSSDILYAVVNPSTTPVDRKITVANLRSVVGGVGTDLSSLASSGSGTSVDPWIIDSVSLSSDTTYYARKGYYSYSTSPNWALDGLQLIGEAGVFFQHTGRGVGFNCTGGTSSDPFVNGVRIENIHLLGNYVSGAGTASASQGAATVTGVGTSFTSYQVGDSISFASGTSSVETHKITVITDNTHLTVDANWVSGFSGAAYVIGETTNGFEVSDICNFALNNCAVRDANNYAFYLKGDLGGVMRDCRCTHDDPTAHNNNDEFHVNPQYGVVIDTLGGSAFTTTTYLYNCNFDHFQTGGVWIKSTTIGCQLNGVIAEDATGPVTGFLIEGQNNTLISCWAEAMNTSTARDFNFNGSGSYNNQLINAYSSHYSLCGSNTVQNQIIGGQFATLTIAGTKNAVIGSAVTLGAATFTDTGTQTIRFGVTNGTFNSLGAKLGGSLQSEYVDGNSGSASYNINAAAGNIHETGVSLDTTFNAPTNTAAGQWFYIHIHCTAASKNLTWNAVFNAVGVTLPTTTGAGGGATIWVGPCIWNAITSKWDVIGVKP